VVARNRTRSAVPAARVGVGLGADVEGHRGHDRPRAVEQGELQGQRALTVEEVGHAAQAHDELGDQHGDAVVAPSPVELVEVVLDRLHQLAVGRVDDLERDREAEPVPLAVDPLVVGLVVGDEQRGHVIRPQRRGVVQRLDHAAMDARHEHDERVAGRRRRHVAGLDLEGQVEGHVVPLDGLEQHDDRRDDDDRHPRADGELGDADDQCDHAGGGGADAADRGPHPPTRLAPVALVHHHARLADRERREHADGVERYEGAGDAAEGDDEKRSRPAQEDDAVAEHQAVAPVAELPGQEPVTGDD
jgi:hypothetical protein